MPDKVTKHRQEVGLRLRLLREHLNLGQQEFGESIGLTYTGVSMIESGHRGLNPEHACRLKRTHGVTLDWLYVGDVSALPHALHRALTGPRPSETSTPEADKYKRKRTA